MNKSLSYLLPLGAGLLLAVLAFRWFSDRPAPTGDISQNAEGIEIRDVVDDQTSPEGVADRDVVQLESENEMASGEIRYSLTDNNDLGFSVQASLPELSEGQIYQLWFEGERGARKAVQLQPHKGGYLGEGLLSSEFRELKVIVSRETTDDNTIEEVMLGGTISIDEADQQAE